ncbi:MAG: Mth938-like domain-containing protein [Woeseiaceae bacterium]
MQFTRERLSEVTIRHVEPGSIRVGDESYDTDVALTVDGVIRDFPLGRIDALTEQDLAGLLAGDPELLIIGTGWTPARPARELVFALARRGIGLETMDTPAACRTFNILVAEGRRAVAALRVCSSVEQ